jgi:hypothetical protein
MSSDYPAAKEKPRGLAGNPRTAIRSAEQAPDRAIGLASAVVCLHETPSGFIEPIRQHVGIARRASRGLADPFQEIVDIAKRRGLGARKITLRLPSVVGSVLRRKRGIVFGSSHEIFLSG